jgi:hypothetical protein
MGSHPSLHRRVAQPIAFFAGCPRSRGFETWVSPGAPGLGFETWVSPRGPDPSRKRTKDCRPGAPGPGFETWVSPRGPAPSRKRTKDCRLQPQSGVRMQPTAQAVGKSRNRTSPCRGERFALTTDCHPDRSFSSPKGDGKRSGGTCRVPQVSWFPRPGLRHEVQIPPENEQKIAGFSRKAA